GVFSIDDNSVCLLFDPKSDSEVPRHFALPQSHEVLTRVLPKKGIALEIGSGTGEHVICFAKALPGLVWLAERSRLGLAHQHQGVERQGLENLCQAYKKRESLTPRSSSPVVVQSFPQVCARFDSE